MTATSGPIAIPRNPQEAPTTSPIQSARSLRSVSSTNSPPPEIASNTLALLAQFQNDRTRQEAKFARLEAKARAQEKAAREAAEKAAQEKDDEEEDTLVEAEAWADIERLARIDAGLEPATGIDTSPVVTADEQDISSSDVLSVDEWRHVVKEDYQQSQFWYSTPFAYSLARHIYTRLEDVRKHTNKIPRIAFLCSPTAFVAFQHLYHQEYKSGEDAFLMEIDERFKIVAPKAFIRYDYNLPTKGLAALQNQVDMVVIDPPYLNAPTTDKVAETVKHLLVPVSQQRPQGGDILLLTGDSIAPYATKTYPIPGQSSPLIRTSLQIEHDGGRLSNEFSGWASWSGAQTFGKEDL